jgi:hypothetical protein
MFHAPSLGAEPEQPTSADRLPFADGVFTTYRLPPINWLMQHYTDQQAQHRATTGARVHAEILERRWLESGVV